MQATGTKEGLLLTHKALLDALAYNPETGVFLWRKTIGRAIAGSPAGRVHKGYRQIGLMGARYTDSRLAWFYMTGSWPELTVDHKDRNTLNCAWANLRVASKQEQLFNRKSPKNKTGFRGVTKRKAGFEASIGVDGKKCYLGVYATAEQAHERYISEAKILFGAFFPVAS